MIIQIQVLEWLGQNLLCFQINHWISENSKEQSYWTERMRLIKEKNEDFPTTLAQLVNNRTVLCAIDEWSSTKHSSEDHEPKTSGQNQIELRLSHRDSSSGSDAKEGEASLLVISCGQGDLRVDCNNYHLLVEVLQSLVIQHLKLKVKSDCIESSGSSGQVDYGIRPILNDLEKLDKNSKDLEESERRVQTELYEAADLIQNLMQQLYIAQQINEFSMAKELLSEISIIFDEAQNSARAYYLNNRERLRITKDASRLREKVSFLLGS